MKVKGGGRYSAESSPAAPVVDVRVGNSIGPPCEASQGFEVRFEAILDTGAAISCVPAESLRRLGRGLDWKPVVIRGASGEQRARAVKVCLSIDGMVTRPMMVVELRSRKALIGRDVINEFCLVLDGRSRKWHLDRTGG